LPLEVVTRTVDPTLPRDGTDLIATRSRDALRLTRRYRVTLLTSMPLEVVMRYGDPTLPRDGTDDLIAKLNAL
jgi:hypothetical protein